MSDSNDGTGKLLAFIIVIAIIGGIGVIPVGELAFSLPSDMAFFQVLILLGYGLGILGLILLVVFKVFGNDTDDFQMKVLRFREAIAFLDMLSQDITLIGSIKNQHTHRYYINPNSQAVRSTAATVLLNIKNSFAVKWAKVVQREVPAWTLIVELPAASALGMGQAGEACIFLIMSTIALIYFILTQPLPVAILLSVGVILSIVVLVYLVRWYRARQAAELASLDMSTESFKALHMVFKVTADIISEPLHLYVLGDYDVISYTGDALETSDGHQLKEGYLSPGMD